MNLVNAELAKISVNAFVTMKISFANLLAALCEQLPGGDVDVVTNAIGHDRRIGSHYLKGALGFGGPCFPRDNKALAHLARELGQPALLAEAVDSYNQLIPARVTGRVLQVLRPGGTVAVPGLAYKPDTNVVEESQGLLLVEHLVGEGVAVVVHDPLAMAVARTRLGDRVAYASTPDEAVAAADVVVIANPDLAYRDLTFEQGHRPLVVDVWRMLRGRVPKDRYGSLGLGAARSLREDIAEGRSERVSAQP